MSSSILSIPIDDVFMPKCGCPLCRMHEISEEKFIEYITGAAMMEPDIRIATNKKGFCYEHFEMMVKSKNKLSVALMLDSHLAEIEENVFGASVLLDKTAKVTKAKEVISSCFVCDNIKAAESTLLKTVYNMYSTDKDFRKLYNEQEMLCLPHFVQISETARKNLSKRLYPVFLADSAKLAEQYLATLKNDIHHFTTMFDYQTSGPDADWKNSKDSIERTVSYLTSEKI